MMGDRLIKYTRKFALMGRHPCTPGPMLRPLEPRLDVIVCRSLAAHACGQTCAGYAAQSLGIAGGTSVPQTGQLNRSHCATT